MKTILKLHFYSHRVVRNALATVYNLGVVMFDFKALLSSASVGKKPSLKALGEVKDT